MNDILLCTYCNKEFPRGRKFAAFCSQRCRIYAKRKSEVTTEDICSHCKAPRGAIFTQKEFQEELDRVLKLQSDIKVAPKVQDLGDLTLVADSQEWKPGRR